MDLCKILKIDDDKNYVLTLVLGTTLFILKGICNGMIDVRDRHF
jgi:hypothetical protein